MDKVAITKNVVRDIAPLVAADDYKQFAPQLCVREEDVDMFDAEYFISKYVVNNGNIVDWLAELCVDEYRDRMSRFIAMDEEAYDFVSDKVLEYLLSDFSPYKADSLYSSIVDVLSDRGYYVYSHEDLDAPMVFDFTHAHFDPGRWGDIVERFTISYDTINDASKKVREILEKCKE
ncbi:MAG: hypothetical protein J6Y37_18510 [Paludibacteraceae bacterium]|nr:hypothetical protein [Paludibacteraceae bacterium]